jgi:hypothetical protein
VDLPRASVPPQPGAHVDPRNAARWAQKLALRRGLQRAGPGIAGREDRPEELVARHQVLVARVRDQARVGAAVDERSAVHRAVRERRSRLVLLDPGAGEDAGPTRAVERAIAAKAPVERRSTAIPGIAPDENRVLVAHLDPSRVRALEDGEDITGAERVGAPLYGRERCAARGGQHPVVAVWTDEVLLGQCRRGARDPTAADRDHGGHDDERSCRPEDHATNGTPLAPSSQCPLVDPGCPGCGAARAENDQRRARFNTCPRLGLALRAFGLREAPRQRKYGQEAG